MVRENNQAANKTWVWTYDRAGNIQTRAEYAYTTASLEGVTPTDTVNYTYGDDDWGDLLTAYDGQTITYDEIGNPLSDGTWTYTWEHGRELASMTDGTTTWSYTYNADGLRTQRTNGTATYKYIYNGSSLVQMTVGSDTLYFTDATVTYNNTVYYYVKNIQGDIIAILDSTGTAVVQYTYDAWGNVLSTTGELANTLGAVNPLRYRGYVYDSETGLYYLQSRYYDPELGRFLNADAFTSTGQGILGNNMFAYCLNSPILFIDSTGFDAVILYDKSFPSHIGVLVQDENGQWWHFYWGSGGTGLMKYVNMLLCIVFIPVETNTWFVEYNGDPRSLDSINASGQYPYTYEEIHYLDGDFSETVGRFESNSSDYHLYNNNCSQVTLGTLALADTPYSQMLADASQKTIPAAANRYIKTHLGSCTDENRIQNSKFVYYAY